MSLQLIIIDWRSEILINATGHLKIQSVFILPLYRDDQQINKINVTALLIDQWSHHTFSCSIRSSKVISFFQFMAVKDTD